MSFREIEPLNSGRDKKKKSSYSMCGIFDVFSKIMRTRKFNEAVSRGNKAIAVLMDKKIDIERQFTHANSKIADHSQVISKAIQEKNRIKAESNIRMRKYWTKTANKYENQIISLDNLIQRTLDVLQAMDVHESLQDFSEHTRGIDANNFFDQFEKTVDNIDDSKFDMDNITGHIQTLLSVDDFGEDNITESAHKEYEELLKEMESEKLNGIHPPHFTIDGTEYEEINGRKTEKKSNRTSGRLAYTT